VEASQPSSTASSREELAPGTPAQQSPPVVSQTATPSGKPLFTFPNPRTQMPPGSVAHMMAQTPQAGRPPPPPEGYARPHSSREDNRMRFTPSFHGPQVIHALTFEYPLPTFHKLPWLEIFLDKGMEEKGDEFETKGRMPGLPLPCSRTGSVFLAHSRTRSITDRSI